MSGLKTIKTIEEFISFVAAPQGDGRKMFLRWSTGPRNDAKSGYNSFNQASGQREGGLSVNGLEAEPYLWGNVPQVAAIREYLAQQLSEYAFTGGFSTSKPYIVLGRETHRGGDNEPIISDVEFIAQVAPAAVEEARAIVAIVQGHTFALRAKYSGQSHFNGQPISAEQKEAAEQWSEARRKASRIEQA